MMRSAPRRADPRTSAKIPALEAGDVLTGVIAKLGKECLLVLGAYWELLERRSNDQNLWMALGRVT